MRDTNQEYQWSKDNLQPNLRHFEKGTLLEISSFPTTNADPVQYDGSAYQLLAAPDHRASIRS